MSIDVAAAPVGGVTTPPARSSAEPVVSSKLYRYDRIQILRLVAATAVVLFHAVGTAGRYFTKPSSFEWGKNGDLGVDLFFVISGFIMVVTVSTRETNWRIFLNRRLQRIMPLYWLATLAMITLLMIPSFSSTPPPNIGYVLRSVLFLSWTGSELPLVYPGWTIEFEMVFYILITAVMVLNTRPWVPTLAVLSAWALLGAAARLAGLDWPALRLFGNPMLLEFGLGILAGTLFYRPGAFVTGLVVVVVGIAGVVAAPWNEFVPRMTIVGPLATAMVLAAVALDRRWPLRSRLSRLFVALGDASYSIYLVQIFVISIGCKLLQRLHPATSIDAAIIATTVATLVVAWCVHRYIERPIGRTLRSVGWN